MIGKIDILYILRKHPMVDTKTMEENNSDALLLLKYSANNKKKSYVLASHLNVG